MIAPMHQYWWAPINNHPDPPPLELKLSPLEIVTESPMHPAPASVDGQEVKGDILQYYND